VDIRNSVEAFRRLSDCRVVEGFVQIVLIDHATESSFANLSFPHLREITHYLLLYRVNGLRSLRDMFPNLAVIRGETLFLNYALVVFEMIHLQVWSSSPTLVSLVACAPRTFSYSSLITVMFSFLRSCSPPHVSWLFLPCPLSSLLSFSLSLSLAPLCINLPFSKT
jgi:hypothetical protein